MSQTRSGMTWHSGHTPGLAARVVGLGGGLGGAAGAVAVGRAAARGVEGVVVVVEEVPAGDVVDVAVARRRRRRRRSVAIRSEASRMPSASSSPAACSRAGRSVVADVERAVVVAVIVAVRCAVRVPRARRVCGSWQLVAVEARPCRPARAPASGSRCRGSRPRVGVAGRVLPGAVGADAGDLRSRRGSPAATFAAWPCASSWLQSV